MRPPSSIRAFTLMEMVVTLVVFVLLSAMVFGIITGVLKSAGTLQENQNRGDLTMALQAFLKNKLGGLPAHDTLVSYRRGDGEGLDQNGIIFGSDKVLTAVDAKVQPNGLYLLRLATFNLGDQNVNALDTFNRQVTSDDPTLVWTSLVPDIQQVGWKFQELNVIPWVDLWTNATTKPNLVELSVQLAGDLKPSVMDFWVPPIYPPSLAIGPAGGGTPPTNPPTVSHAP